MLIQVCLLLLTVGVYASYADDNSESTTEDELFGQLDVFPENFLGKFPEESEFFSLKILVYLFFNLFAKYFGENEPVKFWSKFNHNDFNRVAIDAAFYEYLTKFADKKTKHLIFNPLESSTTTEDIAIHRIGDYLDGLSAADQNEILSREAKTEDKHQNAKCAKSSESIDYGIPGKDFPDYCDIPDTSFTCADKLVPGIYADTETDCQVFHACWPNRIDSYLCPVGTTFNKILLECDSWRASDCSSSPLFIKYSQLAKGKVSGNMEVTPGMSGETLTTSETPTIAPSLNIPEYDETCKILLAKTLHLHMKYLPRKCKVTHLEPSTTRETGRYDDKNLDKLPSKVDSEIVEKYAFKIFSEGKVKHNRSVKKSALLKPGIPSEDAIKQVSDTMITSLELGGRMLNDGILPLAERIVLENRRKKYTSRF